ncbi:MAG: DNA polymerase III subunit gamma/tau, partial [Elusimicrobia bacterium]|nr:DNA polymerase III subunit gamma/tau [Elusimicrobiota bacterium]
MSYLVLARKYRPQTFDDVIGQEEVVRQLKGALQSGRVPHAMLFSGPRGTGKTTCARILARELNKIAPAVQGSLDLDSGMDVIEIDAASNRSIDDIRTLRENVRFVPLSGAFKIYIIDEAHMLTTEAFNALLKTLEEPPAHVKFILATTDPNKMPVTILSRCQRFAFKRIKIDLMVRKLAEICEKEGFSVEEEALFAVARAGQGGMRDALSVLDQLGAASEGGKVLVQDVNAMFGFVGAESLFELAGALARHDCGGALKILEGILEHGKDIRQMMMDLMDLYR